MIPAHRFLIQKSADEAEWNRQRGMRVTATTVAKAATKAGFEAVMDEFWNPQPFVPTDYTEFGHETEPDMMRFAHREFGILPVDWVIEGLDSRHAASPDGLSVDHREIAECKTTGDPWDKAEFGHMPAIPIQYRRQVQWQIHVTGAERCLFLWHLRVPDGDWFLAPWLDPRHVWIDRDQDMIDHLVTVADRLIEERAVAHVGEF